MMSSSSCSIRTRRNASHSRARHYVIHSSSRACRFSRGNTKVWVRCTREEEAESENVSASASSSASSSSSSSSSSASWIDGNFGTYYTKRKVNKYQYSKKVTSTPYHNMQKTGLTRGQADVNHGEDDVDEKNALFTEDMKWRLCVMKESGQAEGEGEGELLSEEDVRMTLERVHENLRKIEMLVPRLKKKLPGLKIAHRVAMGLAFQNIIGRILQLKQLFPHADLDMMISQRPYELLYSSDIGALGGRIPQLKAAMSKVGIVSATEIDTICSRCPLFFLDVEQADYAIDELIRLYGSLNSSRGKGLNQQSAEKSVKDALIRDPNIILSVQKKENLIPYDEIGDTGSGLKPAPSPRISS